MKSLKILTIAFLFLIGIAVISNKLTENESVKSNPSIVFKNLLAEKNLIHKLSTVPAINPTITGNVVEKAYAMTPTPAPIVTPNPTPIAMQLQSVIQVRYGAYMPDPAVISYIVQVFQNRSLVAACIASNESHFHTQDISPVNTDGTHDYGLFQINSGNFAGLGVTGSEMLNYKDNTNIAYRMSREGTNWKDWSTKYDCL